MIPAIANLTVGALLVALAVPLRLGRVPPNHFYGVRLPAAFRSESNWYALNRIGAAWLIGIGLALALLGIALLAAPPAAGSLAFRLAVFAPAIGALVLLAACLVAASRLP